MSADEKMKYMYASQSEIIKAIVIFSILMTVLILNIVIFFTCKYLSKLERNRGLDGKHVKRIRVKSASQMSRDFEKETLRFLMNQLRPSPPQNLDSDIGAVSQDDSPHNFNDDGLTVTVEPCENSAKFTKLSEQQIEVLEDVDSVDMNDKGVKVETIDEISSQGEIPNMEIPNGSIPVNHKYQQNNKVNVNQASSKYVKEKSEIENISNTSWDNSDSVNISECGHKSQERKSGNIADTKLVKGEGMKVSLENNIHQQFEEENSNERQKNCGINSTLEEKRKYLSVNSNLDNKQNNNIVSITITTDDGLESTLNFGSEMDLSKRK